ncbi:MAG TPA: sugar phosphate isomerase/epimerase family protein [Bryobacterales bacterium]|nr:sugar phosphate isomerase/epimerase family protein [Bryobacterales bacterium]
MQLGLVTYNIAKDWDIETIIRKLEAARFSAVELRTTHKHGVEPSLSKEEREKVRERFTRSKVRLLSLGSTCEFHSADPAVRQHNIDVCKQFIELAHDLGCYGVKVRPNGFAPGVPHETTIKNIGQSLRQCGEHGARYGVEVWLEVHGRETAHPPYIHAMLKEANHPAVGACWNSYPTDLVEGSVKQYFDLLRPYLKSCHINELSNDKYPWRELFTLMRQTDYDRWTLCEVDESKEPDRFLGYYRALWTELNRA